MQFQEAAQQRDAEDIADVLDVQAADAEDAQMDEELAQSDSSATEDINTDIATTTKDSIKQAGASGLQAASDAASQAGHAAGAVTQAVTGGNAAGKTKDAHEADLDLSHTDNAPGENRCLWRSSTSCQCHGMCFKLMADCVKQT